MLIRVANPDLQYGYRRFPFSTYANTVFFYRLETKYRSERSRCSI